MKNLAAIIIVLFLVMTTLMGCKKLIEIPDPKSQISASSVFSDIQTANAALLGLYSQMMRGERHMENGGLSIYGGLLADEIISLSGNSEYDPFYNNTLNAKDYTIYYNFWYPTYSNIYQANSIIEGLQNAGGLDQSEKNSMIGEAKLIRSLYYFYLVNIFGPVPLITSPDYKLNMLLPRTQEDSIYTFLITDLNDAKKLLPSSYPSSDRTRPTKSTAAALLARVYLFAKNWEKAVLETTEVINTPELLLTPPSELSNTFLATSQEIIWQLPQVIPNDVNTIEGVVFIPNAGEMPQLTLSASLLNSFDGNDLRRSDWIDSTIIDGTVYYYPYKYKTKYSTDKTENNIVLRLAEQYLIRSEANLKLNNMPDAVNDINIIRARSGLGNLPENISPEQLSNNIALENQHEYFTEWAHRWLDLKRTEAINAVLSADKGSLWQNTDALFPIPLSEIQRNKNLVQNPGY